MYLVIGRRNYCETLTILLVMYVIQCYSFAKSSNRTRPEGTHRKIGIHWTIFVESYVAYYYFSRIFYKCRRFTGNMCTSAVQASYKSLRMLIEPTVGTVVLNTNAAFDDLLRWRRIYSLEISLRWMPNKCEYWICTII